MAKDEDLHQGDEVSWNTSQGRTHGTVEKRLTEETQIKGTTVKASDDDPRHLVESDTTGAKAAHTPEALDEE